MTNQQQRIQKLTDLDQFTGTEQYYFNQLFRAIKYTDGVKYLAEKYGAYWFLDVAFSHAIPLLKKEEFMTAELTVNDDDSADFILTDGNDNILARQKIEWTDFPAREIKLFIEHGVALLPSEH